MLNNQHLTFHREFEALIVEKTAATLDVVNAFAAYQQAIEAEDAAMMKIMKSKLTSDKTNADNDRIKKMTGSFDVIRLAAKHFNTEKNEPGKRLSVLLSTYLKIEQGDYDDRTGRIRNYIQDVRSYQCACACQWRGGICRFDYSLEYTHRRLPQCDFPPIGCRQGR